MNPDQLRENIEKDLFNELRWLLCAATEWDAYKKLVETGKIDEPCHHLQVYTMDSVFLHARSLYEFFTATNIRQQRITWRDYGRDTGQTSEIYNGLMEPLHGRVMHLDKGRANHKEVKGEVLTIAKDILQLWLNFSRKPEVAAYTPMLDEHRRRALHEARDVADQYKRRGFESPFVDEASLRDTPDCGTA